MVSESRWMRSMGVVVLFVRCVEGAATALSVPPSANWYGDDGAWSAISVRVGTPPQWIDVGVSTVSSETWVVGAGGCTASDTQCEFTRGGVFNPSKSSTWQNSGFYELGADKQLGNEGYGQYGLDKLTFGGTGITVPSAIIGAFNGTGPTSAISYLLGLFGLGVVPGGFNNTSPLSALSALVETDGAIPSHSWGYTAGAKYQQKGVVNSLTLGGYDSNRFVPHDITFALNAGKQLLTFLNSISVASSASNPWTKPTELLNAADQVSAIVDSATPYLWLPQAVCERFAQSLGLVYDTSLNLYTFGTNATQHDILAASRLSFTFTLADVSSTPSTVQITLPYAAFDLQLTYPAIPNTIFGAANSTKNYFPLRQAANAAQYTIGRAFLQEAYIITDYERNSFSVHQAVHPSDSVGNTSIVAILPPSTSTFSGVPTKKTASKISAGAIAGIVVGAVALFAIAAFALFFCLRKHHHTSGSDDEKPIQTQAPPRTLLDRLRGRQNSSAVHEASGSSSYPTEIGADATHERFELPAPLGPAELDSEFGTSFDGATEQGTATEGSHNLSSYERARRKLERQQAAHANTLAPQDYPVEKTDADVSQVAHYRTPDSPGIDSPLVSPMAHSPGGFLTISEQHSPVSPGFVSTPTSPVAPPPQYRRINPSNVVYAGRLPDNVQLPGVVPNIVGRDGRTLHFEPTLSSGPSEGTDSSLGSAYTDNERTDLYGSGNTNIISPNLSSESGSGSNPTSTDPVSSLGSSEQATGPAGGPVTSSTERTDPWASSRRLDGEDLVHVPQPAENRFSWEEERISGREDGVGTK